MWLVQLLIKYSIITYGILCSIRWILRKYWGTVDKSNEISAKGKIVLITGANAGVGKATALEFAQRDANVILACRSLDKAIDTINWIRTTTTRGQLIPIKMDLASFESIRKFSESFKAKYEHLDILINNAGVTWPPEEKKKTVDGYEIHMGVNHLGHFLLTNLLLDCLKKAAPSRVVTVSSMAHKWSKLDLNDLMSEKTEVKSPMPPIPNDLYCRSKLACALFSKELAKRVEGTGIRTYALCPGGVQTDFTQNLNGEDVGQTVIRLLLRPLKLFLTKTPQEGAATTIHCALSKNLINESGEMYQNCRHWPQKDRPILRDEDAKKLWEISAKLVGL